MLSCLGVVDAVKGGKRRRSTTVARVICQSPLTNIQGSGGPILVGGGSRVEVGVIGCGAGVRIREYEVQANTCVALIFRPGKREETAQARR